MRTNYRLETVLNNGETVAVSAGSVLALAMARANHAGDATKCKSQTLRTMDDFGPTGDRLVRISHGGKWSGWEPIRGDPQKSTPGP
jgi:hypothetical protein